MKNRQRISRRVLRHFLQLAAASFAIGANVAPASADGRESRPPAGQFETSSRTDESGEDAGRSAYQHAFPLPASAAPLPHPAARARIRVLDASGRNLVQLTLHGPGMVGPFTHGAYTVLIKADGLTEVHRIRIGPDTLPYLHFTESV
ncbi:hypothetical protein [Aromatoleum diolicum]|uniref:Uncharacterized protein n=1 Tax=Aromatoleum diolicum TaxID=75796 RepID=A0ABX1QA84_9RHOO|nr:hypothetical protein [Aromatoleum diolicum]NMG75228.1 hypothetical protein [Aromatoleum diolicum]